MKNLFTILAFWVITIASFSSLAQTPDISVKYGSTNVPNNAGVSNNNGTLFSSIPLSNGTLSSDFTIENRGTGTLTISSIEITGTEAGDFTVGNSPSTTLAPNATTTLRITFNPSVAGRRTATVTITSNDPDESPFRLNFLGFGIEPEMDVLGNGYPIASGSSTPITNNHTHFGAEFVTGGSIVRTFTIENNESAALNLTGTPTKVAITGTHASDFTLTAAPSSPVPRFESTTFQITFNPSGNGVRTALLTIANDDENERPYTFAIEGVGTVLSSSADYTIYTANNTVTINDVGGNGETMEVSESNSNIRFFVSGRTYSIDGGAVTPFTTPADIPISGNTGIVINTNAGHDIINVGAFTSALPSLTINAGGGDDIVNMNGNITFAANANLDLDLQNDDASPGRDVVNIGTNVNVILAGTGSATIKVSQNVFVNTGGGLTTANGNLVVEANQQSTPTSGNFVGVRLNGLNALFQVTGSGLLTVKGKGGNTGNDNQGIYLSSSAKILGGTNTVTLEGIGGPTSGYRSYGVSILENSEVSSTDGNIVMNGTGDGTGFNSGGIGLGYHGVFVRGAIAAGGSGNITITGRGSLNYTEEGSGGVYILSGTVTTAGGNILFNGYGGGSGNARFCAGVVIASSSVSPGGMGTLTLYGEGGPGTGTGNLGVRVSAAITSNGGNITVTGKEGGSNSSHGVFVENTDINGVNGEIKTSINGGDITVTTNSFASVLDNQALITGHPSNKITFLPLTNGTEINFVSTSEVASSPILISDFEFDNVTGGAIHFGNANTGAINVNQAITHAAGNIYLTTGQALNLNQSFGAGTGNITINAAGGINPKATTVDLSGNTISFTSGNNLNIAIGGTTVNTEYDELNIQGAIDLTGLNLVLSGSYVPVAGNTFTIVNNDGTDAITGKFNNLDQGATIPDFRGSGLNATISYTGGSDNNDVVITVASAAVADINIQGNGFDIANGDTSPRTADGTDFGDIDISLTEPVVRSFTIQNTGTADLIIPANGITKSGAADFGIGNVSLPLTIAPSGTATFPVIIDASGNGQRTATISIQSNDADESPYTFNVQAVGVSPEINITGLGQNILDGDITPSGVDDTDFGIVDVASGSVSHTFTIQNVAGASGNLQLNAGAITVLGAHASDFTISAITLPATIGAGQSTTFVVTFNPSALGLRTATVRIQNNDLGEGTYDFAVQGYGGKPFITTWKTDNVGTSNSTSITIPTTGSGYNYDVDWNNDGTFDEFGLTGNVTHNYGTAGTYTVAIRGDFPRIYFNIEGDRRKLVSIQQWGSIVWTSMEKAFWGCENMVLNATDVPNTAAVTDMSFMFANCRSFNQALPVGFNTTAVTDMSYMFSGCTIYNQALPSSFNTAQVTKMNNMFSDCGDYNKALPNSFSTASVTDMSYLFYRCIDYNQTLPSSFNTAAVTNMRSMFEGCSAYNKALPISFNTAAVTNMRGMFDGCVNYNHVLPSSFNTAAVTDMIDMFADCRAYNQVLPLSFNTVSVTNMRGMFDACITYNQALPSSFNTAAVTDMSSMFRNCLDYNQALPSSFNTAAVTDMSAMFSGCSNYNQALPNSFTTAAVTSMSAMFASARAFNQNIGTWSTAAVTNMSEMFAGARAFNQNLGSLNISLVTDMTDMLRNSGLSVDNYDATLIGWNNGGYTNKNLGDASPLKYCAAQTARTNLTTTKGWTITGDASASPATPTASVTVQPTCTISTGTIVVTAPVDGDIQYSIGGPYQISGTFSGLNPGPYTVTAKNTTTGCISSGLSLTVNAVPNAPATPTASVTVQPTCTTPTGTIVVTAPLGTGIEYSIGGLYQTSGTFSGLNPGPYTVTAKNTTTGCISSGLSLTVNAVPSAPATPTASVTVQPTCTTPTGTIEVTAPLGTGIEYSIGGLYQTSGTFSGLNPGPYTVTAKNTTTGCISSGLSLTVNAVPSAPATPTASVTVQPTCTTSTGTIVVTAPVDGDIQYSIGGPYQISGTFSGLDSGPYTVTAKNTTTGCISSGLSLTVNVLPSALNIMTGTSSPICAGATSFTIPYTVVMGTPTTYSVSGAGITTVSNGALTNPIVVNLSNPAVGNAISYTLTVSNASGCVSGNITGSVTVVGPPTISLTTLQQTLNEGNNPVLCDTDANSVNSLQFNVSGLCVSGSPVWRVQVGNSAWSAWSATAPVSQPSNNQPHRYQAACDASCASTYSGVIELTINNRASIPQNVSLVVDGVTVAVGETKEVCSLVTIPLTFNTNCAAGEVTLYSVDGGEYSSGVPTGLVDNQYHNYRVRCRKSDGTPSCVESESGVMRLKLVTIPTAPTVSLSSTSSCDATASFSGQSSCGSLRTVWYNAATNVALPNLPSTVPSATTSYYARCQTENGCVSEKSNVVTFTLTPTQVAPVITASQEIVCTGTTVTISANCPAGSQTFWNTGVTAPSFQVAFNNVTKQTYWAKCLFDGGCQSAESIRKDIYWNAFVVTLINVGETKSAVKPANDKSLWSSQFITRDGGPELEQSTQQNPTLYFVENANKIAPRYWTINVEACGLSTDGSLTFDMLATPEMGVIRSFNTHENNAPYFMYANREGWTELYAQNHPAYGFYQDNGAGGNVYDAGLPKGLYKLGIRYWDMKGWGSIYPSTRQPQGNVLAYQEYWFRIQSKDGVGVGAARTAEGATTLSARRFADARDLKSTNNVFAQVMPNPVLSVLRLQVADSKGQTVQTTLTDATGREVLRRKFVPETNTHQEEFGVSELPTGMYFLKVMTEMQQATLKVVKVE